MEFPSESEIQTNVFTTEVTHEDKSIRSSLVAEVPFRVPSFIIRRSVAQCQGSHVAND